MNIALAQMQIFPAEPEKNYRNMGEFIAKAEKAGAELIIFPQLALSGLLAGEYFYQRDFIEDCLFYGEALAKEWPNTAFIFGNIALNPQGHLINTCYLAQNGSLNLLNPFMGDEDIHGAWEPFTPQGPSLVNTLSLKGKSYSLGLLLGDWQGKPLPEKAVKADLLINMANAPFNLALLEPGAYLEGGGLYINGAGLQSSGKAVYIMAGGSKAYNKNKGLMAKGAFLEEDLLIIGDNMGKTAPEADSGQLIFKALVFGVKYFMAQIGGKRAVIGLSGGVDSALVACVYTAALGKENVLLVNMPSRYNSETTKGLAGQLAEALNTHYTIMPIEESVALTLKQLKNTPVKSPAGEVWYLNPGPLALENLQARDRSARLLATIASSWGAVFTSNGNKAEASVGYATFYGDLAGAISCLADLWKHQVYDATAYAGKYFPTAAGPLREIAALRPSAELSHKQAVDEGKGDPLIYPYHDYLLASWVEGGINPLEIFTWYLEGCLAEKIGCAKGLPQELFNNPQSFIEDLEYWWRMYKGIGVAKRLQAPPILVLTKNSLLDTKGLGQSPPYFSREYLKLKAEILRDFK